MKRFGFGMMRLPMLGGPEGEVDKKQVCDMADRFLRAGFTYFDTAHNYLDGKSELAIRDCVAARWPRERFALANKLTYSFFETEAEIPPLFEEQLRCCGVAYFDYYLLHAVNAKNYAHYAACNAFGQLRQLRADGRARHIGMSFHDKAEVLDRILTAHPEIEFVQIQLNYLDLDDPVVESGAVYDVCVKHGKPVAVMEPVKGGALAELPADAARALGGLAGSPASLALRYAAGFPAVFMVLSGMSSLSQMEENLAVMGAPAPLSAAERAALDEARARLRGGDFIPCTACRYCVDGCPAGIDIPGYFSCFNRQRMFGGDGLAKRYAKLAEKAAPAACLDCGQCEAACPQHLPVRALLRKVEKAF